MYSLMKFGMLLNITTGRYHPILFRPAPMPGPHGASIHRYRSVGHHNEGFDDLIDAKVYVVAQCEKHGMEDRTDDFMAEWGGEGIPAMHGFFEPKLRAA